MSKSAGATDWREGRRHAARGAIVDAAWVLVGEEGLAGLSLRDLAGQAGITTPTVYSYFASKMAIYDAMFGQAAAEFAATMAEPYESEDPRDILVLAVHRFFEFCTSNTPRYQLLFQRTLPTFEPTPESYAPMVRALADARKWLGLNGVTEARHLDMWSALVTGLVDQQVSNDPGGDRWARLVDESIDMFLAHCGPATDPDKPRARQARRKGTPA